MTAPDDHAHAPSATTRGRQPWARRGGAVLASRSLAVGVAIAVTAFAAGWWLRPAEVPAFAGAAADDVATVLDDLARVGLRCGAEVTRHDEPDRNVVWCRAEPTYTLIVYDSALASYESLDVARWAACWRVDGTVTAHQWYMARRGTWNLLTFDRATASRLGGLPGDTVTVGTCRLPVLDWLA